MNATCALKDIDPKDVELLLVPGGNILSIDNEEVYSFIRAVVRRIGSRKKGEWVIVE